MSEHMEVVWDGTDARPLGRLLFPPTLPTSVLRTPPVRVAPVVTPTTPPRLTASQRAQENAKGGAVHHAKDRIWVALEFPRTTRELAYLLRVPARPLATAIMFALKWGVLVTAGHRHNPVRSRGMREWDQLYVRAPQYASEKAWPSARWSRRERAA